MDECDGLENRWGRKLLVGSNPTPSAIKAHVIGAHGHCLDSPVRVSEPPLLTQGHILPPEAGLCGAVART